MKKGISLIVLIITIIVMIIIAGAVIISLSNSNIIDQADKAKTKWDIASIKEQLTIHNALAKTGTGQEVKNGSINKIGVDDDVWNKKVIIQNGKLVFLSESLSENEEQALLAAGIESAPEHISVVNIATKQNSYANKDNVVAPDGLYAKLEADPDALVYILENLDGWDTDLGCNNWFEFYGTLDGLGHTIKNIESPLVEINYGIIRSITTEGNITECDGATFGGIAGENCNLIEYCNNKVNYYCGAGAGIAYVNSGTVYRCINYAQISGDNVSGIVTNNEGDVPYIETEYRGGNIIECVNYGKIGSWDKNGNKIENTTNMMVGGIVGHYSELNNSPSSASKGIYNCYNYGDVAGDDYVGGIVGFSADFTGKKIYNSYNYGNIYAKNRGNAITHNSNSREIVNCFSKNGVASRLVNSIGEKTYVDWINNLVDDGDIETQEDRDKLLQILNSGNTEKVWVKNPNDGYPMLKWQLDK